jgi:hypothetical protein
MISMTVTRTRGNGWAQALSRAGKRVEEGLRVVGEEILARSRAMCPEDTEALVRSSQVRQTGNGFFTVITVGYGIPGDAFFGWSENEKRYVHRVPFDYAVYVHEDPTQPAAKHAHHDFGTHGFLHKAYIEDMAGLAAIFTATVSI